MRVVRTEQRHIRIAAWQVVDRWISLSPPAGSARVDSATILPLRPLHGPCPQQVKIVMGMIRARNLDLFTFAQKWYSLRSSRCQLKVSNRHHDGNTGSRDPSRTIGRHKSDYVGNILRFAFESLQCLHSQRDLATRFGLREIRHIRVDFDSWCDSVYTDAARPGEDCGPILDQSFQAALVVEA